MTLSPSLQEIDNLIFARAPIIWVLTPEENRFLTELSRTIIGPKNLNLSVWSMTSGIQRINKYRSQEKVNGTENAIKALQTILADSTPENNAVYIMRDLFLTPPETRYIRDIYEKLGEDGKTLIIVSPFLAYGPGGQKEGLPPTLEKQICVVEYALPNREEVMQRVKNITSKLKDKYTETQLDEVCRTVRGLTILEIDNAISSCLAEKNYKLDIDFLISFKRQSIRKSQILEFMNTDVEVNDVGGLDKIKEYFSRYKNCFGNEAAEFGVEPLKLVLITGIPGTGKSHITKSIGKLFKLPLLKLDVGKVYGSLVGQSEFRMREAIRQIEGLSPCVVMIDEIEKGLSGTHSSSHSDGGTTSRVFGTLLTAIQDGLKDAILIGTANDITSVPPEFIRRANEIFFVDLPGPEERWEILKIHIEKRGRKLQKFKSIKTDFLNASKGFTGAEIEKAVKDAIARAFYSNSKDVTGKHLLSALSETKPISQVMESRIKELQEWAKGHARYASSYSEQSTVVIDTSGQQEDRFDKISSKLN